MLALLKSWNKKYDIWSFTSDFIFVFGVLVLGWSPVMLILLLIIDTIVMLFFTIILFYKETKDGIKTFGFLFLSFIIISFLIAFYDGIEGTIKHLKLDIDANPNQILNSYILPVILVSSGLNHYAAFSDGLEKMKNGTYKSTFIKHFFLKYFFIVFIMISIAVSYIYLNSAIFIALIIGKALLRIWKTKFRTII